MNISFSWIQFEHLFDLRQPIAISVELMTNDYWFAFSTIFNWNCIELRKTFGIEWWNELPFQIMIFILLFDVSSIEQSAAPIEFYLMRTLNWNSLIFTQMNPIELNEWTLIEIEMRTANKKKFKKMLKMLLYYYHLQITNASIITHFFCLHGSRIQ